MYRFFHFYSKINTQVLNCIIKKQYKSIYSFYSLLLYAWIYRISVTFLYVHVSIKHIYNSAAFKVAKTHSVSTASMWTINWVCFFLEIAPITLWNLEVLMKKNLIFISNKIKQLMTSTAKFLVYYYFFYNINMIQKMKQKAGISLWNI